MIAGLESVTEGDIKLDGKRINDVPPDQRGIAMVFQSYALYPHMTVAENIGFSLDLKKVPKAKIRKEVEQVAELLQLSDIAGPPARGAVGRSATDEWPSAGQSSSGRGLSFLTSP